MSSAIDSQTTTQPPATRVPSGLTRAAALFAAAGFLFAIYAWVRPYGAETGVDTVVEFASVWWLVAHSCAVLGFAVTLAATIELARSLAGTRGASAAFKASIATGIGAVLVLPYYGAETFALHVLGSSAVVEGRTGELAEAESIRFGALAATTFGGGLLLLLVAAVLAAVAVIRAEGPRVWSLPFVVVWALFPVQFFAPGAVRMAYGVLALSAALAFAVAVTKVRR